MLLVFVVTGVSRICPDDDLGHPKKICPHEGGGSGSEGTERGLSLTTNHQSHRRKTLRFAT